MFSVEVASANEHEKRTVTFRAQYIVAVVPDNYNSNLTVIHTLDGKTWGTPENYIDVINKWRNELYD